MDIQKIINEEIPVLSSFSGGKDSTAVCLYVLFESRIPKEQIHIVFADTGWEHHYTYFQVLKMAEIHPVQIVRSEKYKDIDGLLRDRGIPRQRARFCTQELKVFPLREYQKKFEVFVSARGIRHEEATAKNGRGDVGEFEFDYGSMMYSWYPIRDFSLQDVWNIHYKYGFPVNKLYLIGFSRVGCAPCIFARKNEIAKWSELVPGHFDRIREEEERRNFPFFSPSGKPKKYHNRVRHNGKTYASIDEIVRWSKEGRKGKTEELVDHSTCSEGLCE